MHMTAHTSRAQRTRTRAALYVRISQDRTGAGLGVDRQREDCTALAKRLGWSVAEVYRDNDTSAYSGRPRKHYRRMLADIEAGRVDAVVTWHTDRLHRNNRELLDYIDLTKKFDFPTQTVTAGPVDLSTPNGRAAAITLGAWARAESEHKAQRIARKQRENAEAGRYRGGVARPFGYQIGGMKIHRQEAAIVRRLTKSVIAGTSMRSLVDDLNKRGIKTSVGGTWTIAGVRALVKRPRNAGKSVYRGEVVGKALWPAIVPESDWITVCQILNDPSRTTHRGTETKHLLSRIATCGKCGEPMWAAVVKDRTGKRYEVYRCCVYRDKKKLDDLVTDRLRSLLLTSESSRKRLSTKSSSGPNLWVERNTKLERLQEMQEELGKSEDFTLADFKVASRPLKDRIAEIDRLLAQHSADDALDEILSERDAWKMWQRASITRKRSVIRSLFTITVLPVGRGGNHIEFEDGVKIGLVERVGRIGDVGRLIPD